MDVYGIVSLAQHGHNCKFNFSGLYHQRSERTPILIGYFLYQCLDYLQCTGCNIVCFSAKSQYIGWELSCHLMCLEQILATRSAHKFVTSMVINSN